MSTDTKPTFAFTIKRSEWLHGEGGNASRLLRSGDGKMCCVGIYLRALGVSDARLMNCWVADSLPRLPRAARWTWQRNDNDLRERSDAANRLYEENDDAARESEIIRLFAEQGVEVTFVD